MQWLDDTEKMIDTINRQGYEWFVHFLLNPLSTYDEYSIRYRKYPGLRLFGSVAWRLPLMIFPVLPALYVLTRLVGTLVNPFAWYKNFTKPLFMGLGLVLAAGIIFRPFSDYVLKPGLMEAAKSLAKNSHLGIATALRSSFGLGMMITGGIMLAAGIMYTAKHLARWINLRLTGSSTRKHLVDNLPDFQGQTLLPDNLVRLHDAVRDQHYWLKETLSHDPTALVFRAPEDILQKTYDTDVTPKLVKQNSKPWFSNHQRDNPLEAAEAAIEEGKELLNNLESLMSDQKDGYGIEQERAETWIVNSTSRPTRLLAWEASLNALRTERIELPENQLEYDQENSRIISREGGL